MIKILLDQGLPRTAAALLREAGWDVQHVSERGMSQAADSAIIDLARMEQRMVVTLDADFHALLAVSGANRPSVLRIRDEGLKAHQPVLHSFNAQFMPGVTSKALVTANAKDFRRVAGLTLIET